MGKIKYYIGTEKGKEYFETDETEIWKIEGKTAWFWDGESKKQDNQWFRGGWVKYSNRDCSSVLDISIQNKLVREIKERELGLWMLVNK